MKEPIEVTVMSGSAYIRYREAGEIVGPTRDVIPSGSVAADMNASGDIVGLEVLDVIDPTQVVAARDFARANGLAFPRDLAGVLVA